MSRPSLYTVSADTSSGDQQTSILSELEPETGSGMSRLRLILALLLIASLAFAFYFAKTRPRTKQAEPAVDISAESMQKLQPMVTSVTPAEEKAPAVIVADASTASEEPLVTSAPVALLSEEKTEKAAEQPKPIEAEKKEKNASTETGRLDQAHASKPAAHAKSEKDRDVTLIAALLSRGSGSSSAAEAPKEVVPSHKPASKTLSYRNDAKRDVVVRTGNESTVSLLKRCAALGFFEGELCRFRICSGRWGSDPACPVAQQASVANSP